MEDIQPLELTTSEIGSCDLSVPQIFPDVNNAYQGDLNSFSFSEWMQSSVTWDYGTRSQEIERLLFFFDKECMPHLHDRSHVEGYKLSQSVVSDLLQLLSPDKTDPPLWGDILSILEGIKIQWVTWISRNDNFMSMYNGYYLNLSCVPTAVAFWKHVRSSDILNRHNRRLTRSVLDECYKRYAAQNNAPHKFSHVLFALSWLNVLRVFNNVVVHINPRSDLVF